MQKCLVIYIILAKQLRKHVDKINLNNKQKGTIHVGMLSLEHKYKHISNKLMMKIPVIGPKNIMFHTENKNPPSNSKCDNVNLVILT